MIGSDGACHLGKYCDASELHQKPVEIQIATFLNIINTAVMDAYDLFDLSSECTLVNFLDLFDNHTELKNNIVLERHEFWTRNLKYDETVQEWAPALRTMFSTCEFNEQETYW